MPFCSDLKNNYKGVWQTFSKYWKAYGRFSALLSSPYLHLSIIFSALSYPLWLKPDNDPAWFDITLSVIPNLLGFTLGGYAIMLAFSDRNFQKLLAGPDEDDETSPFMIINSSFVHFIIVQILSLLFAIIGLVWGIDEGPYAGFGFTFFIYAIFTGIAATFGVMRLAGWFDEFISQDDENDNSSSNE